MTLKQLEGLTGIPASTLSKVQNHQATLSYEHIVRLASGLGIDVSDVFTASTIDVKTGRRAVTRRGEGLKEATDRYTFEILCGDLIKKSMNTGIMEVTARSLEEAGGLIQHEGEEFVYVLEGECEVHSDDYRPVTLAEGDSMYLDSTSGHAYVAAGAGPCRLLAITTYVVAGVPHLAQGEPPK